MRPPVAAPAQVEVAVRQPLAAGKAPPMVLLRTLLGDALRHRRQVQGRTLREVSARARVSLGYLSEVERGQKEASSELLGAICGALDVPMSRVLREVSDELARAEGASGDVRPDAPVVAGRVPAAAGPVAEGATARPAEPATARPVIAEPVIAEPAAAAAVEPAAAPAVAEPAAAASAHLLLPDDAPSAPAAPAAPYAPALPGPGAPLGLAGLEAAGRTLGLRPAAQVRPADGSRPDEPGQGRRPGAPERLEVAAA